MTLVGLGLLAPLLGLELLLRLAGPILPGEYQTASFVAPAEVVGRRNRPSTAGWKRTGEFTTWVRVNSDGLRGPENEYAKPPGAFRVLALGDSFTFALQVQEEQTFAARLSALLNTPGSRPRIETINAEVDGWSTANEYEWFVTEGYRYQPDLVLLMFYVGNDPGDNADQLATSAEAGQLRLGVDRDATTENTRSALRGRSAAWNMFEQGVLVKLGPAGLGDLPADDGKLEPEQRSEAMRDLLGSDPERPLWSFDSGRKARGWAISQVLLERLRDASVASGTRLVVVEIPTAGQVTHPELTMTPLPILAGRVGLPVVELLPAFRAEPRPLRERLYFEQNGHWTADGHAVVARVLAEELTRRGFLPH